MPLALAIAAVLLCRPPFVPAQIQQTASTAQKISTDSQNVQNHVITVSRSGEATAKPDLGILIMSIRSASPIADEAVAENGRKAAAVESALAGLGFATSSYQISSVNFGQTGGPHFPVQTEVTGYDATQFIYVFFEASDLGDVARLTTKAAAVIEALRKAGAVPANAGPFAAAMPAAAMERTRRGAGHCSRNRCPNRRPAKRAVGLPRRQCRAAIGCKPPGGAEVPFLLAQER